ASYEFVLETEEVKERELVIAVAVGLRVRRGEEVLEAEEVEEGEVAGAVAVGGAGAGAAPAGDVLDGDAAGTAGEVEAAGDVQSGAGAVVEGGHGVHASGNADIERVPLGSVPPGDAPGFLASCLGEGAADVERRAGPVVEDVHRARVVIDAAADG